MTKQVNCRKKVLLIGSGGYVVETIVPALLVLSEQIEIVQVINRSGQLSESMSRLCPELEASTELAEIDFSAIDLIFICIPHLVVPQLLKSLVQCQVSHCDLFVSTPVLGLRDLKHRKLLRHFNQVYAFENAFALPQFVAAKRLIDEGKIGDLLHVRLHHSGFRYHGLALIRHLFESKTPIFTRAIKYGPYLEYQFRFGAKQHGVMVEPRDFAVGRFLLAGAKGFICDYPLKAKQVLRLDYLTDERGVYQGLSVNDQSLQYSELDKLFSRKLPIEQLVEPSLFRQCHIHGAVVIFDAWLKNHTDYLYQYNQTLFDNLWLTIAERLGWAVKLMPNLPKWLV